MHKGTAMFSLKDEICIQNKGKPNLPFEVNTVCLGLPLLTIYKQQDRLLLWFVAVVQYHAFALKGCIESWFSPQVRDR